VDWDGPVGRVQQSICTLPALEHFFCVEVSAIVQAVGHDRLLEQARELIKVGIVSIQNGRDIRCKAGEE
jgi:hypothetical protein